MPLDPRPLHPADHPDAARDPGGFRAWSSRIGDGPGPAGPGRPAPAIDFGHPLVKLAAVAFVGYTLARLIHGRA